MEFRVLTLNAWGLPLFFAAHRETRMNAIRNALASSDYDIICLQEIWTKHDYHFLKGALKSTHPFRHYYHSGLTGSGLCMFSKWPIEEAFYYQFPMNGFFHMVHHGDWFGGKGVGLAVVNIRGIKVNVYNTHLHANYSRVGCKDPYEVHRLIQCLDAALFVRHTSGSADVCIFGGDFNSPPGELGMKLLLSLAVLKDSWDLAFTKEPIPETNDCKRNSFRQNNLPDDFPGLRIDYILCKSKKKLDVLECCFPFDERICGTKVSYSDHEAVGARFLYHPDSPVLFEDVRRNPQLQEYLKISSDYCRSEIKVLQDKFYFTFYSIVSLFLVLLIIILFAYDKGIAIFFIAALTCFLFAVVIMHKHNISWIINAKKRLKLYVSTS